MLNLPPVLSENAHYPKLQNHLVVMTTSPADNSALVDNDFILINGKTNGGNTFRPSDWSDRLHSTLQALSPDECDQCSEYVHLVNVEGRKGILIDCTLKQINSQLFAFFLSFVTNNDLLATAFTRDSWENLKK